MACPEGIIQACDFIQALVQETPTFDKEIMRDIRPTDGWIGNVATSTLPVGTPTEVTQDRFRHVFPNTTKRWRRVVATGCTGNPCDPTEYQIGYGADRLTWYAEEATWATPLRCYNQDMHVTAAKEHIAQIIGDILRPATNAISSAFLRRRALQWAKYHHIANASLSTFTYVWTLGGVDGDEEIYFDSSINPANVYQLVPQMLQNNFALSMLEGYAGKNPFGETSPFIELVTSMDTLWNLHKLGGQGGWGNGAPSLSGNWRFTEFSAADKYWKYGYSGQVGNYLTRADHMGLRFQYVGDLGEGSAPNRYRYQVVLPYYNEVTTGAGGEPGIGSVPNSAFQTAQFELTFQWHKKAMELLVSSGGPINPEMPYGHIDFGGKWQWQMDNLGPDENGEPIANPWRNKGRFAAWFKNWIRPAHTEFARAYFHRRQQFCIPEIGNCATDFNYPQNYNSEIPVCD